MSSRAGVPNRSTKKARELFAPYIQEAMDAIRKAKSVTESILDDAETKATDRIAAAKVMTAAATIMLEYGLGKPTQPINGGTDEDGNDIPLAVKVTFA